LYAQESGIVEVLLLEITHAALTTPIRLSSDPTERITMEPLVYGTRSNGFIYYAVLMSALLPDEQEEDPPKASLAFDNVDSDIAGLIRSIQTPADITMRVVMANTPDIIEAEYTGFKAQAATITAERVILDITRIPLTIEGLPYYRMTKSAFPGLFK
jgi:hypothetical protein